MAGNMECSTPLSVKAQLKEQFIGKKLHDVDVPAAIVDRAVVKRNCKQMLEAIEALHVDFRPHVKTHKTAEVARLQLGQTVTDGKIVVSTVAEAEHLLDFLLSSQESGKHIDVLYGIPLSPSQIGRLVSLAKKLGPGSVSVLVDHLSQLPAATEFEKFTGFTLPIFIKVDTGYHRAGLPVGSVSFQNLIQSVVELEKAKLVRLAGFYSHAGHSYKGDSSQSALGLLADEIKGLEAAIMEVQKLCPSDRGFVLSVGATPTATSIENLHHDAFRDTARKLRGLVERVQEYHVIELHAGVYPFLDLQQLATYASPSTIDNAQGPLVNKTTADIALTVLVEVASVYENRDEAEALIAAGTLALGREPCKSYDGWGVVSDWGIEIDGSRVESGWKVGRISQEHGILTKCGQSMKSDAARLHVGQKLRIWPNHACVAGAGFSHYLVVDSSLAKERQDEIQDVWVRCRGW